MDGIITDESFCWKKGIHLFVEEFYLVACGEERKIEEGQICYGRYSGGNRKEKEVIVSKS
jgi:hypothetical protein